MSLDVITLALAKGYTDSQGGGSTGGPTTADQVSYTNSQFPKATNIKEAVDALTDLSVANQGAVAAAAEKVEGLEEVKHSHSNKDLLDRFSIVNDKLQYDSKPIDKEEIYTIPVTGTSLDDEGNWTITHTTTLADINTAIAEGKLPRIAFNAKGSEEEIPALYELPLVYYIENYYVFMGFFLGTTIQLVIGIEEEQEIWSCHYDESPIDARAVYYYNSKFSDAKTVFTVLNNLVTDSHVHVNKSILDKLSVTDGKLQYDGSIVGLTGPKGDKGDKGDTPIKGSDYWTAADQQTIVADVLTALPTWTGGSY